MRNVFKLGLILMLYSLVLGVALAYVNINTTPQIEANKAKAENAAREEVLPDMEGGYEQKSGPDGFTYWIGYTNKEKMEIGGYIIIAYGAGYSSVIESMVGIDVHGKITGLKILFQKETPGLGARAEEVRRGESEPWFTRQFKGKPLDDATIGVTIESLKKGTVDTITGATITSMAIVNSIKYEYKKLFEVVRNKS